MSLPTEASGLSDRMKVGEKLPPCTSRRFDLADLRRYAEVSGDNNPIHLDAALARQAGLEAPPVHGMLLMSCFEPALEAWCPDLILRRLSAKFLGRYSPANASRSPGASSR